MSKRGETWHKTQRKKSKQESIMVPKNRGEKVSRKQIRTNKWKGSECEQNEDQKKGKCQRRERQKGLHQSYWQESLMQTEYWVGRGSILTLPWLSPIQALQLSGPSSNLLPSLSILITRGATGEKRRPYILRHCCACRPAQSPDCTLLSCMSRLAPFFNSKRVASTLFTAAAQWRADFPAGRKHF